MKLIKESNLTLGLVGAWCPSVSGSGLLLPDLSGYNAHGTLPTNVSMSAASWQGADRSRSLFFYENDYVSIPNGPQFNITSAISIFGWVRIPSGSLTNFQAIVDKSRTAQFSFLTVYAGTNSPRAILVINGVRNDFSYTTTIDRTVWNHFGVTYDGKAVRLWQNGIIAIEQAKTGTLSTSTSGITLGKLPDFSSSQANLDDIRIYNRALTPPEVKQLYEGGFGYGLRQERRRIRFVESALVLDTTPGVYNITGSAATTLANRLVSTTPGAYNITGSAAETLATRIVSTTPGAYDITGESAETILGRATIVDPGAYDITGSSSSLLLGRALETTPGDYDITGSPVDLEKAIPGQFVLQTLPGAYNITGSPVELIANIAVIGGGGPGKTAKRRGWANERARFEESLRTEEVTEQVKAARRVLKKAQSESAQRLGELVAEYEAARASLDELREQVARIERESRIREEVEVASKIVEIFAREEEEIIAILEIIDEMDSRALLAAVGIAA